MHLRGKDERASIHSNYREDRITTQNTAREWHKTITLTVMLTGGGLKLVENEALILQTCLRTLIREKC